jgi:hypothetical protein
MAIKYRGETFSGYNKPKRTSGAKKKFAVLVSAFFGASAIKKKAG